MPPPTARPRRFTPKFIAIVAVFVVAPGLWLAREHLSFNWHSLGEQLRAASLARILLAVAIIYACYILRAMRWAALLRPIQKTSTQKMLGPQLIGFTLVGLFGRVADLARPYLIAGRTQTTVATQLAVYSIERAFDLGAAAILFSVTLAFAPHNMPHHEAFAHAGELSLAATVCLVLFAIALRVAGARIASLAAQLTRPLSLKFADTLTAHILSFSQGLRIVSSAGDFLLALVLSLLMWLGIALAYLEGARAFTATPQLAGFSFAATMLLMATSMGGSVLQLPIVGWFTQIALLAAALHGFFAVPLETASACGTILLLIMNLAVIPAGLIAARIEGVNLREAAHPRRSGE